MFWATIGNTLNIVRGAERNFNKLEMIMEQVFFIAIWYLSGIISFLLAFYFEYKEITMGDLLFSLVIGMGGFITVVISIVWIFINSGLYFIDKYGDKVIFKRKNNE